MRRLMILSLLLVTIAAAYVGPWKSVNDSAWARRFGGRVSLTPWLAGDSWLLAPWWAVESLVDVSTPDTVTYADTALYLKGKADSAASAAYSDSTGALPDSITGTVVATDRGRFTDCYSTLDSAGTQKGVTGIYSTSVAVGKASVTSGTALDVAGAGKLGSIILGDTWLVRGGGAAFNASTSFSVYNDSVTGVDTIQLSAMNRQGAFVAVYNRGAGAGDTVFVRNGATLLATLTAGQSYKGIYTGPSGGGLSWRTW